ncbi:recombination protein NinG [Cronobacter sakazakii]|uniref:recombination protein NinG n=1 Tax=Cronobacter sakazakii TaxID=28141 RepID=UPI00355B3DDC
MSCGTFTSAQWDAGHYRTTAAAPQLRFDERNIHKQCVVCNQHKSGNLVPYRAELIRRIGLSAVEAVESNHYRHRGLSKSAKRLRRSISRSLKTAQFARGGRMSEISREVCEEYLDAW